jgi:hypothetical protein
MDNKLIFEKLFNRNFTDEGNAAFLEKIAAGHPFFTPAQFYLLQKTDAAATGYDKLAARTSLLFNDPLWLNFQLAQTGADIAVDLQGIESKTEPIATATENTMAEESTKPQQEEPALPKTQGLSTEAMLFEPMHMVDYFASQGIKLSEEAQTADKLGKQLKSFTEWLKTMKKVHTGSTEAQGDPTDRKIQSLAEKSNADEEVLTESMAEVFARQGKRERAVDVYQKLSLLNPSKSAYFAAKIESLKGV